MVQLKQFGFALVSESSKLPNAPRMKSRRVMAPLTLALLAMASSLPVKSTAADVVFNLAERKQKQAWLDSEEGRITTLMQQGSLSQAVGQKMLLELAKLKLQKSK